MSCFKAGLTEEAAARGATKLVKGPRRAGLIFSEGLNAKIESLRRAGESTSQTVERALDLLTATELAKSARTDTHQEAKTAPPCIEY